MSESIERLKSIMPHVDPAVAELYNAGQGKTVTIDAGVLALLVGCSSALATELPEVSPQFAVCNLAIEAGLEVLINVDPVFGEA